MQGRLFPVDAEWCEWHQTPRLSTTVLVRVVPGPDGRLVLAGLRIDGAPSAELLRAIPVGRIEAVANAQLTIVDDGIAWHGPVGLRDGEEPEEEPLGVDDAWEMPDPVGAVERPERGGRSGGEAGPVRRRRPDEFYETVAREYQHRAQASARPAAELAAANNVPVSTAHRWVKEARRRGFLPPGRPGKAG